MAAWGLLVLCALLVNATDKQDPFRQRSPEEVAAALRRTVERVLRLICLHEPSARCAGDKQVWQGMPAGGDRFNQRFMHALHVVDSLWQHDRNKNDKQ